ncbi:hypothetical protein JOC86_001510 [Bacillus pakistanensis]|uniref:Maturase K n=1 Tax=Rossellomorea pakistanensis TaxID=992288 RepID=A0ABS2NAT7_9BACI|nr:hypothetical protein [Bacillus pakistanensis]
MFKNEKLFLSTLLLFEKELVGFRANQAFYEIYVLK